MPILDIQVRFRELGRIRMGRKVPTKNNKLRPEKLARFRLTSQWEHLIEQAAAVFGGTPGRWDNDGNEEFEVIVDVDAIPIVIPPGEIMEQWYEMWTGGGCQRRCDGIDQVLVARPCQCPKDPIARQEAAAKNPPQACKPTTRLKVMIPDVSDVGIWRLESHGFHAAAELGGSAGLVEAATRRGAMIPADLRLQAREGARRPGQQTRKFFVPAISFRGTLGPVLDALGMLETGSDMPVMIGAGSGRPALGPGEELPPSGTAFDPARTEAPSLPASAAISTPDAPPPPGPPPTPENAAQSVPEDLPPTSSEPPPGPSSSGERSYSGPQIIAMRFDERGVKDRDEKLRIISQLVGRAIASAKDLTTSEISLTLEVVNDDDAWTELVAETTAHMNAEAARLEHENAAAAAPAEDPARPPAAGDAPEEANAPAPPAPSEHVPADAVTVVGAREPAPHDSGPRGWDAAAWTSFLRARGVKVAVVIREAQRLAGERNLPLPGSVAELVGSGLEEELAGYVEDKHGRT